MQTKKKFVYANARKITNWGCHFDSLTELKYAISIIDDYEFIRERVRIYYDPSTKIPTDYLRSNWRRYTPDFLIRHKTTGEAFLVEIKPRAFEGQPQLEIHKQLVEKYIRLKNYDWKFKVVYDDEIILSEEQLEAFKECCRLRSKNSFKLWFDQYKRRLDPTAAVVLKNASPEARTRYIMFGSSMQPGGWRSGFDLGAALSS